MTQSLCVFSGKSIGKFSFSSKKSISNSDHSFVSCYCKVLRPPPLLLFYFVLVCIALPFDTGCHSTAQADPKLTIVAHTRKCWPTSLLFALWQLLRTSGHLHSSLALEFNYVELWNSLTNLNWKKRKHACQKNYRVSPGRLRYIPVFWSDNKGGGHSGWWRLHVAQKILPNT